MCRETEVVEERAVDKHGQRYMTIKELQAQEEQRRAGNRQSSARLHMACNLQGMQQGHPATIGMSSVDRVTLVACKT